MFSLIDVGERSGSGLCDLYNNWKEFGYKTPVLCETVDPDRISLTLEIEIDSNPDRNDSNDDAIYQVKTFVSFELPLMSVDLDLAIKNETKAIYGVPCTIDEYAEIEACR